MELHRRRFLAGAAAGAAGLWLSGTAVAASFEEAGQLVYSYPGNSGGAAPRLLARALAALDQHADAIVFTDVVGIVDFAFPSREERLHLVDVANGRVITRSLVAHGMGSDPAHTGWVERLSNEPASNASSKGSFLTGPTYMGKHGRSRRLYGLDPFNSLADERGIVVHGASYVEPRLARSTGLIGRSQGCFAISEQTLPLALELLGPGRLLFAWK